MTLTYSQALLLVPADYPPERAYQVAHEIYVSGGVMTKPPPSEADVIAARLPIKCSECNARFADVNARWKHMYNKHGVVIR